VTKKDTPKAAKKDAYEQSKRFIDTAKALESDESGEAFERAFKAVVPPKDKKKKSGK